MRKIRILLFLPLILGIFVLLLHRQMSGTAAPPAPTPPGKEKQLDSNRPSEVVELPKIRLQPAQYAATADAFGYTWDDSQAMAWVDATVGSKVSTLDGEDDAAAGPIEIGFSFPFYENAYSQVFISSNGYLSFGQGWTNLSGEVIPQDATPNNLISVFWQDLAIGSGYNTGAVYYLRGGVKPNRFIAIEFHDVTLLSSTQAITFEVILYETGDIRFQYQSILESEIAVVGIEDAEGWFGLPYAKPLTAPLAVHFIRPPKSYRAKAFPLYQSGFTMDSASNYVFQVRNAGEQGTDVFNLQAALSNPAWKVELFDSEGKIPLADSNQDGKMDTGPIAQGETITLTAKVNAPENAQPGDFALVDLHVMSSQDPTQKAAIQLQSAVPPSFAQVFVDGATGMSLQLIWAKNQFQTQVERRYSGASLGVVTIGKGDFFYSWERALPAQKDDESPLVVYSDIEYAILFGNGSLKRPTTKLTSNRLTSMDQEAFILDESPAMASLPDGRIGVAWVRQVIPVSGVGQYADIFFAILDGSGNLEYGPEEVTKGENSIGVSNPRIAASDHEHFTIVWVKQEELDQGQTSNLWSAIYSSQGALSSAPKTVLDGVPGEILYLEPVLANLNAGGSILVYPKYVLSENKYSTMFTVLDAVGAVVEQEKPVSSAEGLGIDVTQLPNGNICIAWTDRQTAQIMYLILDGSDFSVTSGPTMLEIPNTRSGGQVTASYDIDGNALLTWMDNSYGNYLYFSLIEPNGAILTPPMVFYTGKGLHPAVISSYSGQGNAAYQGSWRMFMPVMADVYKP